jgi:hypothetical protein
MKKLITTAVMVLLLVGCSGQSEAEREQHIKEQIWSVDNDGPMPAHGADDIWAAIQSITNRSNKIIQSGSTDSDCEAFSEVFDVLSLADFNDERQDYIAPLMNATSQVYSACDGRGTWEGAIDDVLTVSALGGEYIQRF